MVVCVCRISTHPSQKTGVVCSFDFERSLALGLAKVIYASLDLSQALPSTN